jgi:ubiquinone/menaquinone biosynthesis C-methylase UbiE
MSKTNRPEIDEYLSIKLQMVDRQFRDVINQIPPQDNKAPHPYWVHSELVERFLVLKNIRIKKGMKVLDIGCGADALTSIALAYFVGKEGMVMAVDRARWQRFEKMVSYTGYQDRIIPLKLDASHLPIPYRSFDLAVIIHGIRSMGEDHEIEVILKELLRVSSKLVIAESLPIAHNPSQQAHLDMYNLREPVFKAVFGKKDDFNYRTEVDLIKLMKSSGAKNIKSRVIEFDLSHYLATFPKEIILKVENQELREIYLEKWDAAYDRLQKVGEAHPPVCIISANE